MLIGHKRPARPPLVVCGVVPLPMSSADTAPFGMGLPPAQWANRTRNAALAVLHRRILAKANSIGEEIYRPVRGAELPYSLIDWCSQVDAFVQFSVPAFEYPRSDAPEALHFAGACAPKAPTPTWTVAGPSYTSPRAPSPMSITGKPSRRRCKLWPTKTCWWWSRPAAAHSTRCPHCREMPARHRSSRTTSCCPAPASMSPTVATGECSTRCVAACRSWRPEANRTSPGWGRGWPGRPPAAHRAPSVKALRRDILAVLRQRQYREASRRIAADMAAAPGVTCLADVVDNLIGTRNVAGPAHPLRQCE